MQFPQFCSRFLSLLLVCAAAPAQSHALQFDGGVVTLPHHAAMHTGSTATLEAWVRADPTATGGIGLLSRYRGSAEHKALAVLANGKIEFLYAGSPWAHGLGTQPGVFPLDGAFHHLAFVRRATGSYSVYLDGAEVLASGPGPCWLTCNIIEATTSTTMGGSGTGFQVRAARWSAIERYSGTSFVPSATWTSDSSTALLLDLEEGQGSTTADSSSHQQIGTLSGAVSWVQLAPPSPASVTSFGTGCGNPPLALVPDPSAPPLLGSTTRVQIDNIPWALAGLALGFDNVSYVGLPLPLDLGSWGMPGCTLLQSTNNSMFFIVPPSVTSQSGQLSIPLRPTLLGFHLYLQGFATAPGFNPGDLILSNALDLQLGNV